MFFSFIWQRLTHRAPSSRRSRKRSRQGPKPRNFRPCVFLLEDRLAPAVFKVNSLLDLSISGGVDTATGRIIGQGNTVTLRSAIEAANATPGSNTIKLTVPGVYKITIPPGTADDTSASENNTTGDFDIIPNAASAADSTLTIVNTSDEEVAVDGNHLDRIFDINPNLATAPTNFTVVMKGFTIRNGIASPGDAAAGSGGGIRDQGNVSLTLTDMVVTNNRATADGGGLVMLNTVNSTWTLTINDSTISNNNAGDAGGGIDTDGTGKVVINAGTVITNNTDLNQGAGLYVDAIAVGAVFEGASLDMTGTVVSNNQALAAGITSSGGGISNAGNGTATIVNCTIANNSSGGMGGGFSDENNQGTLVVKNSLFLNNVAVGDGGGIQEGGPSTTITNTEFKDNASGANGAGLFANGKTLIVQSCTFANNTASGNGDGTGGGGAIELETTGTGADGSTITNTTITGNTALNNGGVNGGGIDAPAAFTGDLKLLNDTINANFASAGGGIFWAGTTGAISVQNTIIAGNFAATGPDANNPAGTFTDLGGNLIGISGTGSGNTGFTATTTQTGTTATPLDPLLGPLQNNGGPKIGAPDSKITLETEAPLKGSPAIGKGIVSGAPATDERGFPSVVDGKINVGAVSASRKESHEEESSRDNGDDEHDNEQTAGPKATNATVFNVNSLADLSISGGVDNATGKIIGQGNTVTLRSAIEAANATTGNIIINLTVPGVYKITIPPGTADDTAATENNTSGDFDIIPNAASASGSTLTIVNTSDEEVAVDGNHLDRIFDINPNVATAPTKFTVLLKGFTLRNGIASPGDGATGSGGAIRDQGNVSLTLTDMVVTNNRATADGGGIAMENLASTPWTLTINHSTISNNHAGDAGGGVETDGLGTVAINAGTVITNNTCVNQGAGIWLDAILVGTVQQSATLSVTKTLISNNKALTMLGGGIGNAGNATNFAGTVTGVTITQSTIENNFTGGNGGGFSDANNQGTLTVLSSLFRNNHAIGNGGGIQEGGPTTSITNTAIKGNTSGGGSTGAGLFANGKTLTVQSSTFANNTSAGDGGGIELETTGTGADGSTITNTTITGNSALNNAGANGGGIDAPDAFHGALKLLNDTINANFASTGGGVFWAGHTGSSISAQNTIIAGNFAATGPDANNNPAIPFTDLGGNLIGISGTGSGNTGFTAATTQTGTTANPLDPLLGPLQDNGGPKVGAPDHKITLETEAPLKGSPAIGKGIVSGAPATDERGFPSVVNGKINVGAVSASRKEAHRKEAHRHHDDEHDDE